MSDAFTEATSRRAVLARLTGLTGGAFALPTVASVASSLLASCGGRDGDDALVVYTSLDEVVAREELALFAGTTGSNCGVAARYDTEAMKTTGLANLLRAERDAPRADVFWSSEQFQMSALASEGVLARLADALLANWPKPWQDTNGRWIALNARARVLCFDSRKVDALGAPQLWSAFAAVEYPAGIVIADPRFGSTRGHFAAMRQVYEHAEPGLFARMLAGLKRSHTRLLPGGNAAVVDAVLRGEAQFGFTDTDDVITAMQAGKPIGFTLPRHFNEGIAGGGTLLIPSTLGIIEGTARRACAEQCLEFLSSPVAEVRSAQSSLHTLPLGYGVRYGPAWRENDPLRFDLAAAVANADAAAAEVHDALAGHA